MVYCTSRASAAPAVAVYEMRGEGKGDRTLKLARWAYSKIVSITPHELLSGLEIVNLDCGHVQAEAKGEGHKVGDSIPCLGCIGDQRLRQTAPPIT